VRASNGDTATLTIRSGSRLRAFLLLQVIFWGANFAIRTFAAVEHRPEFAFAYVPERTLLVTLSFAATTAIHFILVRAESWPQLQRWGLGLTLCFGLMPPMNALETWLATQAGADLRDVSFIDYVVQFGWVYLMWLGYYFAQDQLFQTRRHAQALQRAQAETHAAQLRMLRYQLNPHFLFNALNAVSTLVLEKRNAEAEATIIKLSRFLRHTADPGPDLLSRLGDEALVQRLYLEVEAVRFGDKLKVECDVPEHLYDCLVPSLLLQPIVENAIKHGIALLPQGGRVHISARREDSRLVLVVENDGPPLAAHWRKKGGIGLRNTEDRLCALFGAAGTCVVSAREGGGALVELSMPYQLAAAPALVAAG
jgi:two-component system, LytTR family, sensor kinase